MYSSVLPSFDDVEDVKDKEVEKQTVKTKGLSFGDFISRMKSLQ